MGQHQEALAVTVIIEVKCKKCGAETRLSLADRSYDGLFRCWKCHQSHIFVVENDEIKHLKPIDDEQRGEQLKLDF